MPAIERRTIVVRLLLKPLLALLEPILNLVKSLVANTVNIAIKSLATNIINIPNVTPIKKPIERPRKPIVKLVTIAEYRPLYIDTKDTIIFTAL